MSSLHPVHGELKKGRNTMNWNVPGLIGISIKGEGIRLHVKTEAGISDWVPLTEKDILAIIEAWYFQTKTQT